MFITTIFTARILSTLRCSQHNVHYHDLHHNVYCQLVHHLTMFTTTMFTTTRCVHHHDVHKHYGHHHDVHNHILPANMLTIVFSTTDRSQHDVLSRIRLVWLTGTCLPQRWSEDWGPGSRPIIKQSLSSSAFFLL
jgi:hypothetical protein